jgi:hypothetical protein
MSYRLFEGLSVIPLFASSMCYRRSLMFYDVVVLFIVVLLVSAIMNDCGFSRRSYQVFHLPYVAAMSVDLTIPILLSQRYQALLPSSLLELYLETCVKKKRKKKRVDGLYPSSQEARHYQL